MRQLASFLLLGFALTAGAAEIWRWKDAQGQWHYSDSPVPGAERMSVKPQGRSSSSNGTPTSSAPLVLPNYTNPERGQPQQFAGYDTCAVTAPPNDAVFNVVDPVSTSISVEPALQPGHHLQVLLNGAIHPDWPADSTSFTFTGLYRGSYTLVARVVDESGRTLCTGSTVTFHMRQPSILSPARRPQPTPH